MGVRECLAGLMALALAGCMSADDFAARALEHNRGMAEASDEITLLNIVRAKLDRPIVYSQFSGVSENFTRDAGLKLTAPFGRGTTDAYSGELSVGPSQIVTLATAPLDDVEFYQGVMRPVQIGLLNYYLANGWPPDLLVSLTVEKLDITENFYRRVVAASDARCAGMPSSLACQRIADPARRHRTPVMDRGRLVFVNDPRSPDLFDPFHDLVLRLIVLGLTIDGSDVAQTITVPASSSVTLDAEQIAKLSLANASVTSEKGRIVVTTHKWIPAFRLTGLADTKVKITGQTGGEGESDMTATLRSPDSIVFYVGVYTRPGGADANVLIGGPGRERFVPVFQLGDCTNAVVKVDFEDQCYAIPRDGDGVSMKVVAFLHQVFGLNKKAIEPPAVATVKTIN